MTAIECEALERWIRDYYYGEDAKDAKADANACLTALALDGYVVIKDSTLEKFKEKAWMYDELNNKL